MTTLPSRTGLQLRSLVKPSGELEISLLSIPTPAPAADEVVVRVEATPINPSDIGLLFGAADISTAKVSGTPASPVVTAQIAPQLMKGMAAR
ncbi:MAG: NADH oxidase, partial [Burkholderiaceae bacterium]